MTKFYSWVSLFLTASLLCCLSLSAQKQQNWRWQNPKPQGNTLRSMVTPDANTILMAGNAGMIMKSTDGGVNWSLLETGVTADIYGLSFFDTNLGYAVGTDGTILRTKDCGKSWDKLVSGRSDTLRGVSMLTTSIIIAVGDTGTILKSIDGGDSWVYCPLLGLTSNLNDVFFPRPDYGTIIGDSSRIIFSEDQGNNWDSFGDSINLPQNISFNSVWISKGNTDKAVFVGDEGTIIATTDAGSTWEQPILPVTVAIKDVWFFDDDNGFACGSDGTVLRTKNCGKTWTLINQPFQRDLLTMAFPKDSTGFFGGDLGGIFKTPDGGATFSPIQTGFLSNLTDVTFLDDSFGIERHQVGVAVGEFGAILRTENGGDDWEEVTPVTFDPIEAVTRPRKPQFGNKLWIAGGKFGSFGRIWFSEDSAKTWRPQVIFSQFKFFDITFCDSLNGFVVGLGGVIFCTKDGGTTWTQKVSGSNDWLLDVDMPNDSTGFVVGGFGTILKSTDFGDSWTAQNSGTQEWLTSVTFLDDSFGMASGNHGVILRTEDAGNNWVDISPSNVTVDFTHISLFNGNRASNRSSHDNIGVTAVGQEGLIMYSPDGGDTWVEQRSKTKHPLQACFFSDSVNGTVVGMHGTILRTDSLGSLVGLETEEFTDWQPESPLGLNYPNPFSSSTRIPFTVPYTAPVDLRIFDLQGKQVASLVHEEMATGTYTYDWTPRNLPSGIYVYRLQIGYKSYSRKLQVYGSQ